MKALRGKPNSKDSFLSDVHQDFIPSKGLKPLKLFDRIPA
jgi:hypothetical protein